MKYPGLRVLLKEGLLTLAYCVASVVAILAFFYFNIHP